MIDPTRILAHRGLTDQSRRGNSIGAISSAIQRGFGVEIDLRDSANQVVVSHDPAVPPELFFVNLLKELQMEISESSAIWALNIKSCGLAPLLKEQIQGSNLANYFCFDLTLPELLVFGEHELECALRRSEYESEQLNSSMEHLQANRIWLDCFNSDWFINDASLMTEMANAQTFLVSPELHGRNPHNAWKWFYAMIDAGLDIYICTDHPHEVAAGRNVE